MAKKKAIELSDKEDSTEKAPEGADESYVFLQDVVAGKGEEGDRPYVWMYVSCTDRWPLITD